MTKANATTKAKPKATGKRKQPDASAPDQLLTDDARPETKNKGGRPTDYSQPLADTICERLAQGESMRSVCRDEAMPGMTSVFKWLREREEFAKQYARAKEESADALFEELLEIADNGTNDWMEKHDQDGACIGYMLNGEHVQRSRLRLDTRKWALSKLKPKRYGERISAELTGVNGGPIETITAEMSPKRASELYKALISGVKP